MKPEAPEYYSQDLYAIVRAYILQVLLNHHGNRTQTSKQLKISETGLRKKLVIYKYEGFYIPPFNREAHNYVENHRLQNIRDLKATQNEGRPRAK